MRHPLSLAVLLAAGCARLPVAPEDFELLRGLAENRRRNLEDLRLYAIRGRFPSNEDFPGQEVPYFVDRSGVPCAVAHLMLRSGRTEAVSSVARDANHIRIADVTGGPVYEWILGSGLTQEECALIQPYYRRRPRIVAEYTADGRLARLRVVTLWPIPAEYLLRPHLPEEDRVRSHLLAVHGRLERDSQASITLAAERHRRQWSGEIRLDAAHTRIRYEPDPEPEPAEELPPEAPDSFIDR